MFKKICSFFLVLLVFVTFFGCKKKEYKLEIEISSYEIYVDEVINYQVKVDGEYLSSYSVNASNDFIKVEIGNLTGLAVGESEVTITASYKNNDLKKEFTIKVIEEQQFKLNVSFDKNIFVGQSKEIKVSINNNNVDDFEVFFTNPNICIFEDNKIKAIAEGQTDFIVSVSYNGRNFSKNIPLNVRKETNITTNIPSVCYINQNLAVKVFFDGAEVTDFNLVSSNEDMVEYRNKQIYIFEEGEAILTITFTKNSIVYTHEVFIEASLEVKMNVQIIDEMTVGDEAEFEISLLPFNTKMTDFNYSFSVNGIVKIENNKIIALSKGEVLVSFTYIYSGFEIYKSVTIKVFNSIQYSLSSNVYKYLFLNEEKTIDVVLKPTYENITTFTVSSSNPNIISYNNGKLKGLALGSSTIEISFIVNDKTIKEVIDVTVYDFEGIDVNIVTEDIFLNEIFRFSITAFPSNIELKDYEITSSRDDVLVNIDKLFGNKIGNSTIKVSYDYLGNIHECEFTINVNEIVIDIERVSITGATAVFENTETKLTVKTYPSYAKGSLDYDADDYSIATFTNPGILKGISEGECFIFIKVNNEILAKVNIKVFSKGNATDFIGASYYEDSIKYYNELANGVIHTTYLGYSSTHLAGIDADGYSGLDEMIVPGQYYKQQVNILSVPSSTSTQIIPWANLNSHKWTLTTVKGLINDYEKLNPGKKVIAAVNGDFFDINAGENLPYQTLGPNVSNGEFYRTTTSISLLGFKNDGSNNTLVATSSPVRTSHMILSIYDENGNISKEFPVENLNQDPQDNQSSVYFGTYDTEHNYISKDISSNEFYIVSKASLALPNNGEDFYGLGVIDEVSNSKTLEIGQFAISSKNQELLTYLKKGTTIRCQYQYTNELEDISAAIGFSGTVLDSSWETHEFTDGNLLSRAPRTVIGMRADGSLVMMVIDGRQGYDDMYGADGYELAAIMKSYGCVKAYNLDGGGSSTIVIRTENGLEVLNSPSDGRERTDANCVLIVVDDPDYITSVTDITSNSAKINVSIDHQELKNYKTFITLDNNKYEIVDGSVTVYNLVNNLTYNYQISYQKENGEFVETLASGSFKTMKNNFFFFGLTVKETESQFIVEAKYLDFDLASNADIMNATIDDKKLYFKDGKLTINKSTYGNYLDNIIFNYWYNYGDGTVNVALNQDDYFVLP